MELTWGTLRGKEGARPRACVHTEMVLLMHQCVGCPGGPGGPRFERAELCCLHCPVLACGSLLMGVPGMNEKSAKTIQESQVL